MFKSHNKKRFISGIVLFLLIFNLVGFSVAYPKRAEAFAEVVTNPIHEAIEMTRAGFDKVWNAWEKVESKLEKVQDHAAAVAFKAALHGFLRQFAIDTATWVATGDKGQKPMFITEGWGAYLKNAGNQAAGTFIMTAAGEWDRNLGSLDRGTGYENAWDNYYGCQEDCDADYNDSDGDEEDRARYANCKAFCESEIQQAMDTYEGAAPTLGTAGQQFSGGLAGSITKFLCEPSLDVKLKISAGLADSQFPNRPPKCTISGALQNWDEFTQRENFLEDFQAYWDPAQNPIGITLTMRSSLWEEKQKEVDEAIRRRTEGDGFQAVTDVIGNILTPSSIIKTTAIKPIEEGTEYSKVYTKDIIADAIGVFADTLMGELLNKWIKGGIASISGKDDGYNWITGGYSGAVTDITSSKSNAQAAKEKFVKTFKPDFGKGKSYSILQDLIVCPDPKNPGPTDCVIDESFAQAVQQEMTVQDAIDGGYIKGDLPFGFFAGGLEPEYNQGYPYRSLIILRKYRIIPVGWELAARYIGEFSNKTYNIREVLNKYNDNTSPFYQLMDPNWVLKASEVFCGVEGFGEKLVSQEVIEGMDTNKDGDFNDDGERKPKLMVSRDRYCADERSCIKEDAEGDCLFYGYCTEENRIWDFQGENCDPQYNSCQIFNSPKGKNVSYIKHSLEFAECDADNSGCTRYCKSRNPSDNAWLCDGMGIDVNAALCGDPNGCEMADIDDIDQDGNTTETCTVPYNSVECRLDSGARIIRRDIVQPITPNIDNDIYLDRDALKCDASAEGCHEFIRTKPGLATNLLVGSDFEGIYGGLEDSWVITPPLGSTATTTDFAYKGSYSVSSNGDGLSQTVDTGFGLAGRKFIFSFYARGNCSGNTMDYSFDINGTLYSSDIETIDYNGQWQRFSITHSFSPFVSGFNSEITVRINDIAATCFVDAVQLEEVMGTVNKPSRYGDYYASDFLYLKKAPYYYECDLYTRIVQDYDNKTDCENNNYLWRAKDEICVEGGYPECENFAFECDTGDIGCDLYTPTNGDPAIPGVVSNNDFCPAECNGYDTYKQEATFLESEKFPEFFIPSNEQNCSAANAGCSEFTNLNKLEEGGEAMEYYVYLRPCKEVDGDCSTFYTWVGSEATGFQLKAYSLQDADFDGEPDNIFANIGVVEDMFGFCNDYNDAVTNPECYQFYAEDGTISYHHYKNTNTCSDNCQPYRKTKSNQTDCEAEISWGTWDPVNLWCIYEGLSEESISCPSTANNCYEYKGNAGGNVRKIIDDGFENELNDWQSLPVASIGLSMSSESLMRGGHSLMVDPSDPSNELIFPLKQKCNLAVASMPCIETEEGFGCECQVNNETVCYVENGEDSCIYRASLIPGRTYTLSFWAKGSGNLAVNFSSAPGTDEYFANQDIALSPEWLEYSLGPVFIHDAWDMSADDPSFIPDSGQILESLNISGFGGIGYIDNVILKEVRDTLFLIRPDFWSIPDICDTDYDNNFAPQYMLGCKEYRSKVEGRNIFLKSFHHLCGEDAVGCEALIDTFNSSSPYAQVFNAGDVSEVSVSADRVVSFVNDSAKICESVDKGCMAIGEAEYKYNTHNGIDYNGDGFVDGLDHTDDLYKYTTSYIINNPNRYSETLCKLSEVGCDEFNSQKGIYYFKDPTAGRHKSSPKTCEYKGIEGQTDLDWYIKGTDTECPTTSTLGVDYPWGNYFTPTDYFNFTGECPQSEDTCTEYIDPISSISKNIVFNGDFSQDVDGNSTPDGWSGTGNYWQMDKPISLDPNTLYSLVGNITGTTALISLTGANCNLVSPDESITVNSVTDSDITVTNNNLPQSMQFSGRFFTSYALSSCVLTVEKTVGDISISKAGTYYYLDNSIDKTGCNGIVNYEEGCVLFNNREVQNNGDIADINYDADSHSLNPCSSDDACYASCNCTDPTEDCVCDSNSLIKVKADRNCGQWLYCKSLVEPEGDKDGESQTCLEIGECNSLNDQGVCDGFPISDKDNQIFNTSSVEEIKNKSGYVKAGFEWVGGQIVGGSYPFNKMSQIGGKVFIPNGDFEEVDTNNYPIGWHYEGTQYQSAYFTVVSDPISGQKEGLGIFAPSGKSFLKIGADSNAISEKIDVNFFEETATGSSIFYINADINTRNLFSGQAMVSILSYNSDGSPSLENIVLTRDYGLDWRNVSNYVTLPNDTVWVEIKIKGDSAAEGYFYVDNINIKPVLDTREIAAVVGGGNITVDNWSFTDSIDPDLGPCGQWGVVSNITSATGDWQVPPGGGTAYGFGGNRNTLDPSANVGDPTSGYGGRLVSDTIAIPDNAKTISLWRNVQLRGFDYHPELNAGFGAADAYYLEIRDANTNAILETIESWEVTDPGSQNVEITGLLTVGASVDPNVGYCGGNDSGEAIGQAEGMAYNFSALDGTSWTDFSSDITPFSFISTVTGATAQLYGLGPKPYQSNFTPDLGSGFDGMLIFESFILPNNIDSINMWRRANILGFSPINYLPDDAYYIELRDPNNIMASKPLIVFEIFNGSGNADFPGEYMSFNTSVSSCSAYSLYCDLSALVADYSGKEVVLTAQFVAHTADTSPEPPMPQVCDDAGGTKSGRIQMGDIYYTTKQTNTDFSANGYLSYNIPPSLLGKDVVISLNIVGHNTGTCDDKQADDDALAQIGDVIILTGVDTSSNKYVNQSCRAYPKQDALSCEYIDDAGVKNVGWNGYCLEYDRTPGNEDQCLLWWPVDLLLGEGSSEKEAGYSGKFPVYYCMESTLACGEVPECLKLSQVVSSTGKNKHWSGRVFEGSNYITPNGVSHPENSPPFGSVNPPPPSNNPFEWDLFNPLTYTGTLNEGAHQGQVFQYNSGSCTQTFTHTGTAIRVGIAYESSGSGGDLGDLGFWDNCVKDQKGCSDDTCTTFQDPKNDYYMPPGFEDYPFIVTYSADMDDPGAADYPEKNGLGYYDTPMGKYWVAVGTDGSAGGGEFWTQETCTSTNDGQLVGSGSDELIKRIFAQNYGNWVWDDTQLKYIIDTTAPNWTPPDNICPGSPPQRPVYTYDAVTGTGTCNGGDCLACPGDSCDYCGVPPQIANIKVNNQLSGDYIIDNSGLVNLTFNSIVDSNQSPLVMYTIDWGDGTDADLNMVLGSGISINSRPNPKNSHSFHHLYGYWDMLSKDLESGSIECGDNNAALFGGAANCPTNSPCCATQPKIKIKDNWGWCSNGLTRNDCGEDYNWASYNDYIIIAR